MDFLQHPIALELRLLAVNWMYILPQLIILLSVGAKLGRGMGLPNLFRDDNQIYSPEACWRNSDTDTAPGGIRQGIPFELQKLTASPAFWTGFGFVAVCGLSWIGIHSVGEARCTVDGQLRHCPTELFQESTHGGAVMWLIGGLVVAGITIALFSWFALRRRLADFSRRSPKRQLQELKRTGLGSALGFAFVMISVWFGTLDIPDLAPVSTDPFRQAAIPYAIFVFAEFMRKSALPCVSIFSLVILFEILGFGILSRFGEWAPFVVLALVGWLVYANSGDKKFSIPGFEHFAGNPQHTEKMAQSGTPLLEPLDCLKAWHARATQNTPGKKPVLALLATSGGAYRASFWTSLVMDRLIEGSGLDGRWPGLASNLRLITGASGGMVAGSYFVAMSAEEKLHEGITDRICRDTRERMGDPDGGDRVFPIARDSLSPVAHQLARRDLLNIMLPIAPKTDRGRVLDQQWTTLCRPFRDIVAKEREGIATSIILSPMLVETGSVALFSNLNLKDIRRRGLRPDAPASDVNKTSVEIFDVFRGAHNGVTLATATRLNATFPYISPAISLPIKPGRRPVDAGYYDNYGVDQLTSYLEEDSIADWITENCAGVAVLQVRAFPADSPTELASPLQKAFQFLTSPVEGLLNARGSSQLYRNDHSLNLVRTRYNHKTGREFLRSFTFEANSDVAMSWYTRCDEIRALDILLNPPQKAELTWDGDFLSRAEPGGAEATDEEIKAWIRERFPGEDDISSGMQKGQPSAAKAQYQLSRQKVAREFRALETFWHHPEKPDPRYPKENKLSEPAPTAPDATREAERELEDS
ncbi:hypothetical protein [Amaricoccus tamworthensis]|uniref:hypothetical protein n=1 Tax=Amaricoccus tamworthensis TaxID=57002 RepID=UPI003C7D5A29